MRFSVGLLAMMLVGCTAISANPIRDVAKGPVGDVVVKGLQDAAFNLDSAVKVGALSADDPAPACLHAVLTKLGADPANPVPPGASFAPRVSDLISAGSVAYIRLQQLKKAQGAGIAVPVPCEAIIGRLLIDTASGAASVLPGSRLLPGLR